MEWKLKDHGESLEREAATFVSSFIPNYEKTWAVFIGHQGNGQIAQTVEKVAVELEEVRKNFAEHHYTVLESLYFMYKLAEEEEKVRIIVTFDEYREMMNALVAFYAYSGRTRDNLLACYKIMGYPTKKSADPTAEIKEFYVSRNTALHYKKIPLKIDKDGMYLIPKIGENSFEWNNSSLWKDAANIEHEYLSESMMSAFKKMVPTINKMLSELFELVYEFRIKNSITLTPPRVFQESQSIVPSGVSTDVSGLVSVYGFLNPSNLGKKK